MVATMIAASFFAAGTIGYAVTVFAVNFAVSMLVSRAFADNPEQQQDMGVRQQVPPSAVNAIPVVYGSAYMGGTFVDAVLTTDQKCMYYVLAISSISPNGQFTFDTTDMYYGDRKITFAVDDLARVASLTDEAGNVDTKINGNLYIGLYKSNAAGVITAVNWFAPSDVMAQTFAGFSIPVDQVWPASGRQMYGTAFAIVRLEYNREADATQLKPITFHVNQTLNGTGVAKPGDVWYDYITNPVYGGAVDPAFVNSAAATTLNTYSDEIITFTDAEGDPSTQPRYRINGILDAGQSVISNIDRIMSSCDSWLQYNAALGQWSVVVNKAESAAYFFNDTNIIGEVRVSASDITSSINQVEARFPFKENRDQAAFINIETPVGLLYPNEPVNKYSITYDLVNDSVQAHYLANRLLEQAREDLIVGFNTTYYGIQVDAGNVVSVTNADYGWNSKLFRVMKVNESSLPDGSLGARLDLTEYNAQVYDDKDITQFTPIPNSGLASVSYFSPLAAPTATGFPTAAVPNFNVQIYIPATGRVTYANLFYTTVATPSASDWRQLSTASSSNSSPVTNGTYYTFTNIVAGSGVYYFAYLVGNDIGQSNLSPISTAFNWAPVAPTGPTGPTGASLTGPTGTTGDSARICYSKTTLSSLASSPATITTGGNASYPPNDSWGSGTVWGATAPAISAGESVYQSTGTYFPASNVTVWTVPYLSTLKVGELSAITVNTGGLVISNYIRVQPGGVIPAVSGSTMTGSGAVINSSGSFAYGNATKNLSFDGSTLTMNGDLVVTGNVVNNAITRVSSAYANSTVSGTGFGNQILLLSASITTSVDSYVYALFTANQTYGGIFNPNSVTTLFIGGVGVAVGGQSVQTNIAVALSLYLAAGVHTVQVYWTANSPLVSVTDRTLYVQGSQR